MEEKNYKQKLIDFVDSSNLSSDQKELWNIFVKLSYPHEDEAIFEAVTEEQDSLELLTKFLRDKILHMKNTDIKAWRELIKNESRYAELLG